MDVYGSLAVYTAVATVTPIASALLPGFTCFRGRRPSPKAQNLLLALSAGLLLAIATLDLIPEGVELGSGGSSHHHHQQQQPPTTPLHRSARASARVDGPVDQVGTESTTTTRRPGSHAFRGVHRPHPRPSHHRCPPCHRDGGGESDPSAHHDVDVAGVDIVDAAAVHRDGGDMHDGVKTPDVGDGAKLTMQGVGCGFILLLAIEFIMRTNGHAHSHGAKVVGVNEVELDHFEDHSRADHAHGTTNLSKSFGVTTLVALGIHCAVDGFVIASAFSASSSVGARVALALCLHKIPDGLVMASVLDPNPGNPGSPRFLTKLIGLSMCTPLGALSGYMLMEGVSTVTLCFFLGFGAGTFLYLGATAILPELAHAVTPHDPSEAFGMLLTIVASFIGFGIYSGYVEG